ncbi:MAG: LptF/LptG family permease [Phycisphaerae bacterium]
MWLRSGFENEVHALLTTLHAYVLRELLKTFALTVVALTGLFTMGGGLYNVLRYEGVTTADLIRVLPWLLPIVVTVTMPIAALFATTITYGRFAADNEFTACRAAGVNVHYLFLSAVLLSVFVALVTIFSANFVIPDFVKRIDRYARSNLRDLAYTRLRQRGFIRYGQEGVDQYVLTAQGVDNVTDKALRDAGFEPQGGGLGYFWVDTPTFLWIDREGELVQFTLAQGGLCQFDTRQSDVKVTVYIQDARMYEVGRASIQVRDQVIGPITAPIPLPLKPSMVDLQTLVRWRRAPWEAPEIEERVQRVHDGLRVLLFTQLAARQLESGQPLELQDERGRTCHIRAAGVTVDASEIRLADVHAELQDERQERPTRFSAPEARITTRRAAGQPVLAELNLLATIDRFVEERGPLVRDSEPPRSKPSAAVERLRLPEAVEQDVQRFPAPVLLDPATAAPADEALSRAIGKLRADAERLARRVLALIHFRLGFASSALVTILMGAMLGVIFRGARVLGAFALACIPFGTVTILMLMGRSVTESRAGETLGPLLIWGGLAAVGVADWLILRLGVRR